ncbi:MAG: DUF2652 domain-containing protein [Chloroflexota bacterium]
MKIEKAALVLVDISGYTQFIHWNRNSQLHAEHIITELIEAVIDQSRFPLELNKLEGDAVFLYTTLKGQPEAVAKDVLKQSVGFFDAFREKQNELINAVDGGCGCPACTNIHHLQLKAFLHTGEVIVKQVRQFTELAGEDVILIHRLLKNSIDSSEYILLTDAYFQLSGDQLSFRSSTGTEDYPHSGSVGYKVYFPTPAAIHPQHTEGKPLSKPMSKPRGIIEIMRFMMKIFWRQLSGQLAESYHHLPHKPQQ